MRVGEYPMSDPDFFTNSPGSQQMKTWLLSHPIRHIFAVQLYSGVAVTWSDDAYDGPLKREFDVPAVNVGLVDHATSVLCTGRRYEARCGPSAPAVG